MKDKEDVYDAEISPLMKEIIRVCKEHGIPHVCVFEYAPHVVCHSTNLFDSTDTQMRALNGIVGQIMCGDTGGQIIVRNGDGSAAVVEAVLP